MPEQNNIWAGCSLNHGRLGVFEVSLLLQLCKQQVINRFFSPGGAQGLYGAPRLAPSGGHREGCKSHHWSLWGLVITSVVPTPNPFCLVGAVFVVPWSER